jgi:uncharacterized protein (TIGR02453 family)
MKESACFTRATFGFLRDLADHNDREWFAEHRDRYEEDVKAPALRLIQAFAPELGKLSAHFTATPRSLFRIHRDVRFSKDKSPYKTSVGVHFRHEQAKSAHAPGFYLHVEPKNVFVALGIWRPDGKALRAIREHIVEHPDAWRRAAHTRKLTDRFSLEGDQLKRVPRGFDPEHPLADDLRRKDFIAVQRVTQGFVTDPGLPKSLAKEYRRGSALMGFLCDALGVPF